MAQTTHTRVVYINNGEHDNPHELPKENSEGSLNLDNTVYTHTDLATKLVEEIEKLEYMYQHFQDCEKIHKIDPQVPTEHIDDTLYPQINNDLTSTQCAFNIIPTNTEVETNKSTEETPQNNTGIDFHSKHKNRDTVGDAHIQYHNFDNGDAFTYKDKYTALFSI